MLDEIIQIDPELVKEIEWTGDPDQYNLELFELGEVLDSFLVVNPWIEDQSLLHYIDEIPETNECIVWSYNGTWVAKYFTKDWYLELGYKNLEIVKPKYTWRKNQDLDRTMTFEDDPFAVYEPDPWDSQYELVWYIDHRFNPFPDKIWAIRCRPMGKTTKGTKDMGYVTPNVNIEYNEELPDMNLDVDSLCPPYYDLANECAYLLDTKYTPFENIWVVKFTPAYRKPKPLMWIGTITPEFKIVHNPLLPKMEYNVDYQIPWRDFKYDHMWFLDEKHWEYSLEKEIWAFKIVITDSPKGTKIMGNVSPIVIYEYNPSLNNVQFNIDYNIPYHDFAYEHVWMLDEVHTNGFLDVDIWAVKARVVKKPKGTKNIASISPTILCEYNPILPEMDYNIKFDIPYYDFNYDHYWMLDPKHCLNAPEPIWAVKVSTIGNHIVGTKTVGNISPKINLEFNPDIVGYVFHEEDVDIDNVQYHDFNYTLTWILGKEYSGEFDMWAIKGTFVKEPTGYKEMGNIDPSAVITYNPALANLKAKIDYKIPYHDRDYVHVWYLDKKFSAGEKIWVAKAQTHLDTIGEKDMGIVIPQLPDKLDVIFISYNETNAEENWQRVLEKAPWAKRVDGIKGIFEAHKAAAKLSDTDMFYVVDGDAYLADQWQFNYQPGLFDRDCVYVWSSKNPINDLIYGYGGVKLFSKTNLLKIRRWTTLDLTTSMMKLKVISKISNISNFNTDEFSTWRSAFREGAKLYNHVLTEGVNAKHETIDRLEKWKTLGLDKQFGQYAIDAVHHAIKFVDENSSIHPNMMNINNREWLEQEFDKLYPGIRKK